jgi:hypothetical protein
MTANPRRRRACGAAAFAGLAGLALAGLAGGLPAAGAPRNPAAIAQDARPVPRRATAARAAAARQTADLAALTRAKAVRRPVVVAADTTQTSLTLARPDGTLATTIYALPVRIRFGGRWHAVSTMLRRTPGGWSPLTPSRLVLSGGGAGPLAVLTYPGGGTVTVRYPGRLPAPAVAGPTASYAIRPGAVLLATATQTGGVALTLRLARTGGRLAAGLSLPVTAAGLWMRSGREGLAAVSRSGQNEFTAAPPVAAVAAAGASRHVPAAATPVTTRAITLALARPAAAADARSAQVTAVLASNPTSCTASSGIACSNDSPHSSSIGYADISSISGCGQGWNGGTNDLPVGNDVYVYTAGSCAGSVNRAEFGFDTSSLNTDMKIQSATFNLAEKQGSDANANDTWPLYLHWVSGVGSGTSWGNKPSDLNGGNPIHTVEAKPADAGSNGTVYVSYSVWDQIVASKGEPNLDLEIRGSEKAGEGDPEGNVDCYDNGCNSNQNSDPCSDGGGDTGNGLSADNYNCGWMHLYDNPSITTVYDYVPPAPLGPGTDPDGTDGLTPDTSPPDVTMTSTGPAAAGCVTSAPGAWIGKTSSSSVQLHADIYTTMTGEDVRARYAITDLMDPSSTITAGYPYDDDTSKTGDYSNWYGATGPDDTNNHRTNTTVVFPGGTQTSPGTPMDGHIYQWSVQAEVTGIPDYHDTGNGGHYDSATTGPCYFSIDADAPSAPNSITSSAFPAAGGSTQAGGTGTFTISGSTDPVPSCSGCVASGLYGYAYSLNNPIPTGGLTGGNSYQGIIAANSTGTATTPSITVNTWGANVLWVEAVDNAGNHSQPTAYHFFVPANIASVKMPGDVDGDGIPDLLATNNSGGLDLYNGPITSTWPTPASPAPSSPGQSPDGQTDWNQFQITHRGSFTQAPGFDDLIAHVNNSSDPRSHKLYFYANADPQQSTAVPYGNYLNNVTTLSSHPVCTASPENGNCGSYPGGTSNPNTVNWQNATQILAIGDAWASSSSDNTCGGTLGTPSLLTVENDQLWLYQGGCGANLNGGNPVELGSSGWANITLIAPGMIGGQLTLWARDNTSGALYDYPIGIDPNGVPTLSNPASTGTPIAAGTLPAGSGAFQITGITLNQGQYPIIASNGDDATGSAPNLYAIDTNGNVVEYAGITGVTSDQIPISTTQVKIGTVPAGSISQLS